MNEQWKQKLIAAAREVIRTEKILRANPLSWAAFHRPGTPEGNVYETQSEAYKKAKEAFWTLTDVEYDDKEPLYEACWSWRYWEVMARKCCWYQRRTGNTEWAGATMQSLHRAEFRLMKLLGLGGEYKSPSEYIEEQFPNLR